MPQLTNGMVVEAYRKYTELALDVAEGNLKRQINLIDAYPEFPPEYRKRVVEMLLASSTIDLVDDLRADAWNALRKLVAHHRSFSDAEWAMDEDALKQIEEVSDRYLPRNSINRYKWVLDDQWPETGFKADDFDGTQQHINKLRQDAVKDILTRDGWNGIHQMIKETRYPQISAIALAEVIDDDAEFLGVFDVWAKEGSGGHLSSIRMASRARLSISGHEWTVALVDHIRAAHWTPATMANALLDYPADLETFGLIASLGHDVEKYYWEHCWLHVGKADATTKKFVAEKYIQYGRAADMLSTTGNDLNDLGVDLVLRIIDETIKRINEGRLPADRSMFSYYLENALKWLRKQPAINPLDIARLEYPFLSLLTGRGRKDDEELVLHKLLSQDADFFVQVLCDLYKPANKAREQQNDEAAQSRAMAGLRLLDSWKLMPGLRDDGSLDKDMLVAWVEKARELAHKRDRADIADQYIGKILYHAPSVPTDKNWPATPVLDLIERLNAKHIGRGFALESVNSRGVTSRAPLDGGNLERVLEETWRKRAKALGSRWPRVRALFGAIADDWKSQAKWHDEDAEKMRMRWS